MWKILVCDKGIVLAGIVSPDPNDPLAVIIDKCHTVRVWGTTKGVGQLALEGPTSDTKLDPEGDDVKQYTMWIMREIACTPEASKKWTKFTS